MEYRLYIISQDFMTMMTREQALERPHAFSSNPVTKHETL